jgi:DNA-binding NarL/FixJ family response regulator
LFSGVWELTTNDRKIKLVIASDNTLFREGLCRILKEQSNIEIVGEAVSEIQAAEMINDFKPDIVLLGITLTDLNGLHIIPLIKQKSHTTKAIIISGDLEESTIVKALEAGAKGYLPKDSGISCLVNAIEVVQRGELWVERKLMAKYFNGAIIDESDRDTKDRQKKIKAALTPREQEVLNVLIKGATNKEIAQELFIAEKTVKSHLNSIFKKLDVRRRIEAILYAIESELC